MGVGGKQVGIILGLDDGIAHIVVLDQASINVGFQLVFGNAVTAGSVALGVEVYDKDLFAQCCHAGAEVYGASRFAHASFLVCYCDYLCHAFPSVFLHFKAVLSVWILL